MSVYRALTPEQRYRQAMRLARRSHDRSFRDFLHGRTEAFLGPPLYDRERECIVREIGRAYEAGREAERAKCLGDIDYIRQNIRNHQTPEGRKRFDIYDLDRVLRNTCMMVRDRITGDDEGKWEALVDGKTEHGVTA